MSRFPWIAVAIGFASTVFAVDRPQEARKITLRDTDARGSFSWVATFPGPFQPLVSPAAVGAVLRITAGTGDEVSWALPAPGWTENLAGTLFRYRNPAAPAGPSPVRFAIFKYGRGLKVAAKSSGLTLDEPSQGTVVVQLTVGNEVWCSTCATADVDETGRYRAKACPAPPSCAAVCGDGVVEPGEQCDVGSPGQCAAAPPSLGVACDASACTCCGQTQCAFGLFGTLPCCGDSQCQDTTGAGSQRVGACIPPTCATDADCHGYRCVGGTCCGNAGQFCGVAGCCPDSASACTYVPAALNTLCCRPSGVSCGGPTECCSFSCSGGLCD